MAAIIAWQDQVKDATLTTTSGTMLRPLDEVKKPWARGLARGPANGGSFTPATLVIRADLGSEKVIHTIGGCGLNAVSIAQMNVKVGTSPGASDILTGTGYWEAAFGEEFGQAMFWHSPAVLYARYVEVEFQVYGRPAGQRYVDLRRLIIMAGHRNLVGWDRNWAIRTVDNSDGIMTKRGGVFIDEQSRYRELRFGFSSLSLGEAKTDRLYLFGGSSNLQETIANAGRRLEVVCCPRYYSDPTTPDLSANTIYGRLVDWDPIQHVGGDRYACNSITVHETPYPPLS